MATVGAADANSYLPLADAQSLIAGLIESSDVTSWASATTDQKNRALYTSAQRIDRERFLGSKVNDTQSMQWPRSGVRKPDTYINTYATGFPFRIVEDFFTDTEIPEQLKKAQAVLAAYLNNNKDALDLTGLEAFTSINAGSVSVTPYRYGAVGFNAVPPMFERYFNGLRISGPSNIAVKRS